MNILGRYLPTNSFFHQLDPRFKLIASFFMIFITFTTSKLDFYFIYLFVLLLMLKASKVPFKIFLNSLKGILFILLLTLFLQLFFNNQGSILFHYGIINITDVGLMTGTRVFLRFVIIILITTILTSTTSPIQISDSIEYLLSPLKKFNVPVADFSLIISIALRFVPIISDSAQTIIDAQKSRGSNFESGGLIKRVKAFIPVLLPLFVTSFQHSMNLADSMVVRGFTDSDNRSKYRILKFTKKDIISMIVLVIAFIIIIAIY